MKHNYLFLSVVVAALAGLLLFSSLSNPKENRHYQPRERGNKVSEFQEEEEENEGASAAQSAEGAIEYLTRIRANQDTKTINIQDVIAAQKQASQLSKRKGTQGVWKFRGPDNIGGRTRAILIDKDNSNLMYAGGVSGGLWKSTTAGQYWEQVHYQGAGVDDFANLAVVSICQAANGDVYFGTGEVFLGFHGTNTATPMIMGAGIWKSTDRTTFERLESTWTTSEEQDIFKAVSKLAADPTNKDLIYAATLRGLKVSTDGGTTWTNAALDASGYDERISTDVKVGSNGTVAASIGNMAFIKKAGEDIFKLRSGQDELEGGDLITASSVGRLEFAFSSQDPDYIYSIASKPNGSLRNIYKSTDGGTTWVIVGKGGSSLFNPLGNQGYYDLVIAVLPFDKERILVGGLDVWEGKKVPSGNLFSWSQISYQGVASYYYLYVHADQHTIVFDPKNPKLFYVGSDGGIGRGYVDKDGEPYSFNTMNKNYGVTQFYSVDVNGKGDLIGGTQDNSTLVIDGSGNNSKNAMNVLSGDGGQVAMSTINPTIAFGTIYYGGLFRNVDANFGDWNTFYSSKINDLHWASDAGQTWNGNNSSEGSFVTPVAYWETDNDELGHDTIYFVARRDYKVGEQVSFSSENIFGAPIPYSVQANSDPTYPDTIGFKKGDTIKFHDPYGSLFALGMARTVWFTRSAADFRTLTNNDWFRGIKSGVFQLSTSPANTSGMETTEQMVFSKDGNNLFIATDYGNVFRLGNLKYARDINTADAKDGKNVVTTLTKIGGFGSRAVTGLATDPNNPDNLIVTLGNYTNSKYVYLCTKATTAGSSSSYSNFIDITYGLPQAPVYCALIEQTKNQGTVMLGTDLGVFMAQNVFEQASSTIAWEPVDNGLDPVPVFQIKQQTAHFPWTLNNGMIYIGTHGLGFFEYSGYLTSIDDDKPGNLNNEQTLNASIYPNPVVDFINLNVDLKNPSVIKIEIYNMKGQLIHLVNAGQQFEGENTIQLQLNSLEQGAYLMHIESGEGQVTKRFIKK